MWDWEKGGAEMVMNTAYIFVVMLSSKARTLRFWGLQWENLDWNNFTSPPPDPFTSFLVCDNTHSLISLQALPHRLLKPSFFPFWPDYDTSSFETLFMLSSPLHSFLLCAIPSKTHKIFIPYLIPLACFQMPLVLCKCFPIFSDSLDESWLI